MISGKYVGATVRRREDPRLLTGAGRYIDDVRVGGCLYAAIVRSPHAHARLMAVRLDAARRHPGVVACFAFADLEAALRPLLTAGVPPPPLQERVGFEMRIARQFPLATGKVRYVGDPIAVVIADTPSTGEDALALVEAEFLPLAAVTDRAFASGRPSSMRNGAAMSP